MGNKRVVGEGSQIRNAGKSKWFARLVMLAMGLVLSVGGVLGTVHFINRGYDCTQYTYATSGLGQSASIDANGVLHWSANTGSNTGVRAVWLQWRDGAGNWHNLGLLGRHIAATTARNCQEGIIIFHPPGAHYMLPGASGHIAWGSGTNLNSDAERRGSINLWNLTSHIGMGTVTLRVALVEQRHGGSGRSYNLSGNSQNFGAGINTLWLARATLTWTRTATLGTPNPTISGSTISWGAVANATGYQLRRGTTVLRNFGAGTLSYNLATMSAAELAFGTNHTNLNVVATRPESYWHNAASGNRTWARRGTLATPTGVAVNINLSQHSLVWTHDRANTTHFEIRRGAYVLATVPVGSANAHSFDLSRLPNTHATNALVGSYRALAVGEHSLTVVARNLTAGTLWDNSGVSGAAVYNREARIDSVSITAQGQGASNSMSMVVEWPRPLSVDQMPSVLLSAVVVGVHGTDKNVTWTSSNPSIASVDNNGFVRATWPENMWTQSQLPHLASMITARSVFNHEVVGQFTIQIIFADPPYATAIGINVDASGSRDIELAPCGTKLASGGTLVNATQFFATAYGFNLTSAQRGVTWSSSETGVATIDSATGQLTVRGVGVTRITATSVAQPFVPYAFYVSIVRDGTAIATGVTIFCDNDRLDERRLGIIPGDTYGFVDLRAVVEGHNIVSQLVTWTSSCGASVGVPSEFLTIAHTADGVRVTGRVAGGPFVITATPVEAVGAVGTFRIFVDQLIEPEVTNVSIAMPATNSLVIPLARPILATDLPSVQLTAAVSGVGGAANSNVIWTSSCGARAGVGIDTIAGEFVTLVLNSANPNIVTVIAVDRGQGEFAEQVTITATSVVTSSVSASRELSVEQAVVTGVNVTSAIGGQTNVSMIIPYGYTDVNARGSIDLRAIVGVSHASVSQEIIWVVCTLGAVIFDNKHTIAQPGAHTGAVINVVTLRPVLAGTFTITAKGALCGKPSNEFTLEIMEECRTSVRIMGPVTGAFGYDMNISWPRPDDILLPIAELVAFVGGSFARASSLVWTSSCGGEVVEFLGSNVGNLIMIRALSAGVVTITATEPDTDFAGTFIISVDEARLESLEILGDNVVREQTAMLIPLVYTDGVYTLSDVAQRQMLELSLSVITHGDVSTDFVWTSSDPSVIRINGTVCYETGEILSKITDRNGFVTALPYGVGTAVITATSTIDPTFYATFTIFVTRGTASCSIQDGILDLPTIQEGYVRIILVCERYFGQARMSHVDMTYAEAMQHILPMLQIDTQGAVFLGWSLSRGGSLLQATFVTSGNGDANGESENYESESGGSNIGEYVVLLPMHFFNLEAGVDTLLLFGVWYIPYVASESNGSNLARNIIIGTLSVAGVGAAGTAGYVAQSRIRKRRETDVDEWTMD